MILLKVTMVVHTYYVHAVVMLHVREPGTVVHTYVHAVVMLHVREPGVDVFVSP